MLIVLYEADDFRRMIVVAVVVLNLFFPGQYLTKRFAMELSSKHSNSSSMSSTPLEKPVKV